MTLIPVVLLVCAFVGLGIRFAVPIAARLGTTVIGVMIRIMAIILAAVAIEMVVAGALDVIDGHYFKGSVSGASPAG